MQNREQPYDIFTKLEEAAGLPEMRGTAKTLSSEIADIEDYLDQIEPDVSARTRESLVTEAQRRGMVSAERKPWIKSLSKLATSLGRIAQQIGISEGRVASLTELMLRGQEMELEPYQLQYSVMVDRNTRLLTGFIQDRELELDKLWDKLKRTRQLDDMEWERANQLADLERGYIQNLQSTAVSMGVQLSGGESAGEMLARIGANASETTAWERNFQESGGGGTDWSDFDSAWDSIFPV